MNESLITEAWDHFKILVLSENMRSRVDIYVISERER